MPTLGLLPGLLVAIGLTLQGCKSPEPELCDRRGSGSKRSITKSFEEFTALDVRDGIDATVSVGETSSFSITMHANVAEYFDSSVEVVGKHEHRRLVLRLKEGACNPGALATIVVKEPLFEAKASYGSSVRVDVLRPQRVDYFSFSLHGVRLSAISRGSLFVETLEGTVEQNTSTFVDADAFKQGSVMLRSGVVPGYIHANLAERSTVELGSLTILCHPGMKCEHGSWIYARDGSRVSGPILGNLYVDAREGSIISGITADHLQVDAWHGSSISATVTKTAHASCHGGGIVNITDAATGGFMNITGDCQVIHARPRMVV